MFTPGPWQMIILFVIILLLFGNRIPQVAKSLGKGITEFKKGVKSGEEDDCDDEDEDDLPRKKSKKKVKKEVDEDEDEE